ncbi:MAG: LmeA family phospholipid-binding protein [Nostochopsis sp.]
MELLTILISSLLGVVAPVGVVIDQTAENAIRSQFSTVEELQVRVDNAPNYQLLQGKVERVLIAGRSLQLKQQDFRIAALELETDQIEFEPSSLRQKLPKLKQPFQAGVRLVVTEQDINKLLQSPDFLKRVQKLNKGNSSALQFAQASNFVNPKVEFLANNRFIFQVELQNDEEVIPVLFKINSGLSIVGGRQFQLVDPQVSLDGQKFPAEFLNLIISNINQQLDLRNLEGDGLQMRILKWKMKPGKLEMAAFFRVEPSSKLLETRR